MYYTFMLFRHLGACMCFLRLSLNLLLAISMKMSAMTCFNLVGVGSFVRHVGYSTTQWV